MSNPIVQVADGIVVSLDYVLCLDDGRVVKGAEQPASLVFIQGRQQIVPGLEQALYGMASGEEKDIVIEAIDGFGPVDPAAFKSFLRQTYSALAEVTPGARLRIRRKSTGQVQRVKVVEVDADHVLLDFNHPLAGKTLYYQVHITALRQATPMEWASGEVDGSADEGNQQRLA